MPNVQLHAILPFGAVVPSNNPVYLPGGLGPSAFGLTDRWQKYTGEVAVHAVTGTRFNEIEQPPASGAAKKGRSDVSIHARVRRATAA